jgi:hypothetical protein
VQQYGGERPTVNGGRIEAGQHQQGRRDVHSECDRKQQGDTEVGGQSGQAANAQAGDHAGKNGKQVAGRKHFQDNGCDFHDAAVTTTAPPW